MSPPPRRLHSVASQMGVDTPGPASYALEGDARTSKYRHSGGPKFGTGGRFNTKGLTF